MKLPEESPAARQGIGLPEDLGPKPPTALYKRWVLAVLLMANTLNFVDRQAVAVLQEPIKRELGLLDWHVGVLSGLSFAIFYCLLGIPIARVAERGNRARVIAAAIAVWSVMTAMCGVAQSFVQLLICRVGVATGEAGASPAAHSLISDYYPPEQRGAAIAVYSFGIPVGTLIAAVFGGQIAQAWGWRWAFIMLGLPGVVVSILIMLTLRDLPRGFSQRVAGQPIAPVAVSPINVVFRRMIARRSSVHNLIGLAVASLGSYATGGFMASYLIREFGLQIGQAGLITGAATGVFGGAGLLASGFLSDRLARWGLGQRAYALVCSVSVLVAAPLYILAFCLPSLPAAVVALFAATLFAFAFNPSSLGLLYNTTDPSMRATTASLMYVFVTFVGLGLGPLLAGAVSDLVASHVFTGGHFVSLCRGGAAPGFSLAVKQQCLAASTIGLRYGLVLCTGAFVWAGVHYALCARALRREAGANAALTGGAEALLDSPL